MGCYIRPGEYISQDTEGTSTPVAIASAASSSELPLATAACCSPQPVSAEADLRGKLADLLRRYHVNDYAASVKVYAVK